MKSIWLVRHGESLSQTGESDDHLDPDLSELGVEQARRLVTPLRDQRLDCILISPLRRAWRTYVLSNAQAAHVEYDSRLIESDWGIADRYAPILPVRVPDVALPDRNHAWLVDVQMRAESLVAALLASDWQRILVFGHWGVFAHIFGCFAGLCDEKQTFRATMGNAGISLLEVDGEGVRFVRYWNERAHLMDMG